MDNDPNVHLSKFFPTAIVMSLALQTVAVVWWAATTDARVKSLEVRIHEALQILNTTEVSFEDRIRIIELAAERNGERLTNITSALGRIERMLEHAAEGNPP